jgi:ribosomal protein S12 methylthiotransferase accessory factor
MAVDCLDALSGRYRPLVGARLGVIQHLALFEPGPGDPPLYYSGGAVCDVGRLVGGRSWQPPAGGVGVSPETAVMSAVGEAVERYCSAFIPTTELVPGAYRDLSRHQPCQDPRRLSFFSRDCIDQQKLNVPMRLEDHEMYWAQGRNIHDDEPLLLPAPWVYLPYSVPGEAVVVPGNSTGLCCAPTIENALTGAILEAVERDAYVSCWRWGGQPPRLKLPDSIWAREIKNLVPLNYWQHAMYDLTGDSGIPVILVVLQPPCWMGKQSGLDTWYCHGAAAHPDPVVALKKALMEACLAWKHIEMFWPANRDWTAERDLSNLTDFDAHTLFYNVHPEYRKKLKFLDQGPLLEWGNSCGTAGSGPDPEMELSWIKDRLSSAGIRGGWIDLTTSDAASCGLHVVRALLDDFIWLHGDYRLPFTTPRSENAHDFYDYIAEGSELNRWPHSLG